MPGSEILDETDATGSTTNAAFSEYIYFDGKRAARRDYQSNVFYYFADQVGSARGMAEVASGSHTATPCFDADFYPFGGEHDFLNSCPQNYKFMGKERDPETNNDDFGARSYASAYGRFLSADWSSTPTPVPYANLTNPQTLNLYAMVSDNPESFADLDGHACYNVETGCGNEDWLSAVLRIPLAARLPVCICDDYHVDKFGHSKPHIDRVDRNGKLVGRYDENGNPIDHFGKTPARIPRRDQKKVPKGSRQAKRV